MNSVNSRLASVSEYTRSVKYDKLRKREKENTPRINLK